MILPIKMKQLEFFVVAASSGTKQVGDVEDLMIKGIDALVILPHNPATLQKVIEEAYGFRNLYSCCRQRTGHACPACLHCR